MQKTFIVNHLDLRLGPLTKEEVLAKVESKEIFPTDYVFIDEKNDWVMIFEFFEKEFMVASASQRHDSPPPTQQPPPVQSALPKISTGEEQVPQFERRLRNMALVPPVKETKTAPPVTKESFKTTNKITFVNGQAHFNMAIEKRSILEFQINQNSFDLKLMEPLRLHVNSGPAEKIIFRTQSHLVAGEDSTIEAFAVDQYGNIDLYFSDDLICVSPTLKEPIKVVVKDGRGTFKMNLTKAGEHQFNFTCRSQLKTKMEPLTVTVKGAPAVQIIAVPPEFIRAGQKTEITFKAVDRFGNIDHTFDKPLEIEIKSSSEVISPAAEQAKESSTSGKPTGSTHS